MSATITPIKEAVSLAKSYVEDLFADEGIAEIGLEEVEFDDASRTWRVTVGFARPSVPSRWTGGIMRPLERSYKVVTLSDSTKR
ncbi:MAG TPA: hypothetical protein VL100_12015, partial [Croceibacterium sp.]|nr:hypothetical protein [Croceibacterium sp.]